MERKGKIINKVDEKIKPLSNKTSSKFYKSFLQQNNTLNTLNDIHNQFGVSQIDPIGKANGNVAFICKKIYALVLTKEPGLDHNNSGVNKSDIPVNKTNNQVNSGHTTFLRSKFNLIFDLLGTKLHKHLSKAKFIIAAPECFVKPLSNAVISVLKLRYKQIKNYNSKIHFFS